MLLLGLVISSVGLIVRVWGRDGTTGFEMFFEGGHLAHGFVERDEIGLLDFAGSVWVGAGGGEAAEMPFVRV